ncbi:MAG: hypothetical protein OJF58_003955 [Enhydrobacter sp.]|nr:MAG: hypothetical protein OJF58_003955 [Enhydrobacter sp.]
MPIVELVERQAAAQFRTTRKAAAYWLDDVQRGRSIWSLMISCRFSMPKSVKAIVWTSSTWWI